MFARGVDLNIALKGTIEHCLYVSLNISMILIIMLEETNGFYNYFRKKKWSTHI